ncbi:hypothetical protein [Roseovarius sp. MBR-6]|uniref:hypothetical protein n=1 Tax=Roseovarius sp. MBR-6 TaxID=3156459 RepID=UPI003396E7CB
MARSTPLLVCPDQPTNPGPDRTTEHCRPGATPGDLPGSYASESPDDGPCAGLVGASIRVRAGRKQRRRQNDGPDLQPMPDL